MVLDRRAPAADGALALLRWLPQPLYHVLCCVSRGLCIVYSYSLQCGLYHHHHQCCTHSDMHGWPSTSPSPHMTYLYRLNDVYGHHMDYAVARRIASLTVMPTPCSVIRAMHCMHMVRMCVCVWTHDTDSGAAIGDVLITE